MDIAHDLKAVIQLQLPAEPFVSESFERLANGHSINVQLPGDDVEMVGRTIHVPPDGMERVLVAVPDKEFRSDFQHFGICEPIVGRKGSNQVNHRPGEIRPERMEHLEFISEFSGCLTEHIPTKENRILACHVSAGGAKVPVVDYLPDHWSSLPVASRQRESAMESSLASKSQMDCRISLHSGSSPRFRQRAIWFTLTPTLLNSM